MTFNDGNMMLEYLESLLSAPATGVSGSGSLPLATGCVAPVEDPHQSISLDHLEVLLPLIADLCHGRKMPCLPFDLLSTKMVTCGVGSNMKVSGQKIGERSWKFRQDLWLPRS